MTSVAGVAEDESEAPLAAAVGGWYDESPLSSMVVGELERDRLLRPLALAGVSVSEVAALGTAMCDGGGEGRMLGGGSCQWAAGGERGWNAGWVGLLEITEGNGGAWD